MRTARARIPITRTDAPPDPDAWHAARDEILRWQATGAAHLERDGETLDLVTVADMATAAELDGCDLVVFDQDIIDAFRAQYGDI